MVDCPHWSSCSVTGGGCCAIGKFGGKPSLGTCRVCLGLPPAKPGDTSPARAVPREKWPRRVKLIAKMRREGEAGVGDTLARMVGNLGADKLAELFTRITGKDCGCANRKRRLNVAYPYITAGS